MCLGCHVVTLAIEMKSLQAIKAACKRLGWTFKEKQRRYKWFNVWADDSPVPRHLFDKQADYDAVVAMNRANRIKTMNKLLGHCDHAISVPGCRYEVGLIQKGEKLLPIWDWYDSGLNKAMGGNAGDENNVFAQAYGIEMAKLQAQMMGLYCTEHQMQDGSVKLTVQLNS